MASINISHHYRGSGRSDFEQRLARSTFHFYNGRVFTAFSTPISVNISNGVHTSDPLLNAILRDRSFVHSPNFFARVEAYEYRTGRRVTVTRRRGRGGGSTTDVNIVEARGGRGRGYGRGRFQGRGRGHGRGRGNEARGGGSHGGGDVLREGRDDTDRDTTTTTTTMPTTTTTTTTNTNATATTTDSSSRNSVSGTQALPRRADTWRPYYGSSGGNTDTNNHTSEVPDQAMEWNRT
ncbi:MAG: hypothetical protein M1817_002174 [Caeruleum heppii]|nr:MAG: hypothetical protein M1817_002174 [Caeruleum heppii]